MGPNYVYEKNGGTVSCTYVDPVGNCQNSSCQTTSGGETTNGNLDNQPQKDPVPCTGPKGQCKQ